MRKATFARGPEGLTMESRRSLNGARMTRFRTIEPVIVSFGTMALFALGAGALLAAWMFT